MMSCNSENKSNDGGTFTNTTALNEEVDFDLHEIQDNGELIVLTLYGPYSYFEFRGEYFGAQYSIADAYANSIGTCMRVEVCKDVPEMLDRLEKGDGDVIAYNLNVTDSLKGQVQFCGQKDISSFVDSLASLRKGDDSQSYSNIAWAVRKDSRQLASSLESWIKENSSSFGELIMPRHRIARRKSHARYYPPRMHAAAPILDAAAGKISVYDNLFRSYASTCRWDWRLLAAQAYQESGFDPNAVSWMGALGLMQLMPSTAKDMGVADSEVFNPERSVQGAVRLIAQLDGHFSDIRDSDERINFILAAYNAGVGHVDDSRALCRKNGRNPDVWLNNVDSYVLRMSEARYYNDPVVKHGYFRGSETYDYVSSIRSRWNTYRQKIRP